MDIEFLGAAETVTGSKYLIQTQHKTILIDCGLYQGYKELRLRNWAPPLFSPEEIDAVFLSHAHIDHSGYLPLLVKSGFKGPIYCTHATRDLCAILLPDSGHLLEEEAFFANRHHSSKHDPALPLYTSEDAKACIARMQTVDFEKTIALGDDLNITFYRAGHILGAAMIRIEAEGQSLLFTGDLGRPNDPLFYPPHPPIPSDYFIVESTYGNRVHEKTDPLVKLEDIIRRTTARGGVILFPAFAVGRAQMLLYYIYQLKIQHRIPNIPVYIDSPMAREATKTFFAHPEDHRLSADESEAICQSVKYIQTVEESKSLDTKHVPIIIISASGMATGGRVLHHIKAFGPRPRNSIVFCGYQAGGTRGDRMIRQEPEIKIFGEMIPIKAEVEQLHTLSAHVDKDEMIAWLAQCTSAPKKVFLTHGEMDGLTGLKQAIDTELHWPCDIAHYQERVSLNP